MELSVEEKIVKAAKEVFLKNGYNETNMADIAEVVSLTRPTLNYYFRTKERLFQAVFSEILRSFIPKIKSLISADLPLEEKIEQIVQIYFQIVMQSPELPLFILKEANRDSSGFIDNAIDILSLLNGVKEATLIEMEKGYMRKVPPLEVFYTFYGLITFPFLTKPFLSQIINPEMIDKVLNEHWRENVVRQMVFLLKPETQN